VARKNSRERPKPRKKPRQEPGSEGWPVLFSLCQVEIITVHGQDVQTFIDDQQGQKLTITVVVEGAASTSRVNVSWLFIADHS
jgi:folate-binding Fe-S cluster repair protein YgfZ